MKINLGFLREVLKRWAGWLPDEHKKIGEEFDERALHCPIKRQSLVDKLNSIRKHIAELIIPDRKRIPRKWLMSLISYFISKLQPPSPPTS